ncbi:hypothetical protein Nmar_0999 [Nitrosopumilus maritimus SCM1]|uniref:Uncharacterized protein n=2 Tax=Nitrosopumilus maritimus TaxID=338192 RepID=A9A3G3_NITMS|nr:hypothetical protein Nmar_0999 [Nitrosopumilus maritimus SCM1]
MQMKLDFTPDQVVCSENLVKLIKKTTGDASCVKPKTAERLSELGWSNPLSEKKIEEISAKKAKKGEPAGTIEKIATLKQSTKVIKGSTATGVTGYAFVFDACADSKTVRNPEIFVTSDSETKSVKLGSMLKANSCYTSSVIIKAADPNSISATLLNKGGISEKISSLETQITDLKERITAAKQKIPRDGEPSPENLSNISTLKKELKSLQDQLRRYLMVLYVPPNTKATELDLPKSITGQPLEGMSTNLISVTEAVAKPDSSNPDLKRYDVVFEACTGKDTVRIPVIDIVSDSASTTVKLIDRIVPNSCQVGIAKINALDSESIEPKISTHSKASSEVEKLEKKIDKLQTDLSEQRKSLNQLTSKKLDSTGEEQATEIVQNIEKLRLDLLENRTKLYKLLLLV